MPISLDVPDEVARAVAPGGRLALRHPEGMVDERLAGAAHLPVMGALGLFVRPADQLLVDAGVVRLDGRDQLVDEVVLMTFRIEDRHELSLLAAFRLTGIEHRAAKVRAVAAIRRYLERRRVLRLLAELERSTSRLPRRTLPAQR